MSLTDRSADIVRRLVLIERIPMFSGLSPSVLYGLAERAVDLTVTEGQPLSEGAKLTFVPLGERATHRSESLDAHAPGLLEALAGEVPPAVIASRANTTILRVDVGDLHAVLEEEFSLFLAVARAVAGALTEVTRAVRGVEFGEAVAPAPGEGNLELIERVLCLRATLPFAHHRVASLVQLARLASEVRADDGVELFRQSEASDGVLLPISGVLRARVDGRDAFILAPGSVLPIVDAVSRQPRWFSATASGPCRALAIPTERFIDVLEDQPELARGTLRSLSAECLRVRNLDLPPLSSRR